MGRLRALVLLGLVAAALPLVAGEADRERQGEKTRAAGTSPEPKILRFQRPLTRSDREALRDAYGLSLEDYAGADAFLERLPGTTLDRLRRERFDLLASVDAFTADLRRSPSLEIVTGALPFAPDPVPVRIIALDQAAAEGIRDTLLEINERYASYFRGTPVQHMETVSFGGSRLQPRVYGSVPECICETE